MTNDTTGDTYTAEETGMNRRDFLRTAGAAGAVGATGGLAGCAAILDPDERGDGGGGTDTAEGGQEDYRCRSDVLTVDVYRQEDLEYHFPDEDPDYIQQVAKEYIENDANLGYLIEHSDIYSDIRVNVVDEPFQSKFHDTYALFEGPYFDRFIREQADSEDWANHSNILLRDNESSSLLGIAIMDWTGELCDDMTQTCTMNYAHLLGDFDRDYEGDEDMIPIARPGEQVVDNMLRNAIVTTAPHEIGHTLNLVHRDGRAKREENFNDDGDNRVTSSTMGSFYSLAFAQYGLSNTCGRSYAMPEVMGGGMGPTIFQDGFYLKNGFSRCARTQFLKTSETDRPRPRDPIADRRPEQVVEAWKQSDALSDAERAELDRLWEDVDAQSVAGVNLEVFKHFADNSAAYAEQGDADVDPEEARQNMLAIHTAFRDHIENEFGEYIPLESGEQVA